MLDVLIFLIWIVSWFIWTIMWWSMLIILPFLLSLWLTPLSAIATANFSLLGWFLSGWFKYFFQLKKKLRLITFVLSLIWIIWVIIWIFLLKYISSTFDEKIINFIILFLLIIIFLLTLFKKNIKVDRIKNKKNIAIWCIIFLILSIYWWLIWVWNWIFIVFSLVMLFNLSYLEWLSLMTITWFFTWLVWVWIFYYWWHINFNIWIPFLFWIIIWWYLWAHLAIKKWDILVKKLFIFIVLIMIFSLLYKLLFY